MTVSEIAAIPRVSAPVRHPETAIDRVEAELQQGGDGQT